MMPRGESEINFSQVGSNCMFWLGVRRHNLSLLWGSGTPSDTMFLFLTKLIVKWYLQGGPKKPGPV